MRGINRNFNFKFCFFLKDLFVGTFFTINFLLILLIIQIYYNRKILQKVYHKNEDFRTILGNTINNVFLKECSVMSFYEEISKYYDFIFPIGKEKINFIKKVAGEKPKDLLDVACGTGGYSLELSKQGYNVTAVDLDYKMVEELRNKSLNNNLDINILQGNMLELNQKLNSKYDLVFCIGNSLVHLNEEKEIEKFFKEIKSLLKKGGSLVIQIINYDRVLMHNVNFLPTIENKDVGIKFKRIYNYDKNTNKVLFKTILQVNGKEIENEIALYPILSKDIIKLLRSSGFESIQLFGDFKGNKFEPHNSYPLVVVAY
ncbi:class I SAM-dependent methyltransferase [Haloimpatiens sp. FM7330]|uniref:class I SAM-dependent methyltransferase n=1 Tax=Haloimpatiens sp. FM7330 TaxID=3298610 RepID=UPI0036431B8B